MEYSYIDYAKKQELIRKKAAEEMQKWIDKNGLEDRQSMIQFAKALSDKYGEAAASYACEMYDAIATAQGVIVPSAIPAQVATYGEVGKAINGSLKQSELGNLVASVLERLVKQSAEDTMLKNAARDGAEFAWIPDNGACAFCIMLASRGWQHASKKLQGSHAEHIHANCGCEFAIRFDKNTNVKGYDPEALRKMYDEAAPGMNSETKLKALRNKLVNEKNNMPEALSRIHVNKSDQLYKNLLKVKPIDGFEDFAIHGLLEESKVEYETNNGIIQQLTAKEYANVIKSDPSYKGGNIRLLSCGMGNEKTYFAKELANELNVIVLAPTEILWVGEDGDLFISNNEILMDLWYNNNHINTDIKSTGEWKKYSPD